MAKKYKKSKAYYAKKASEVQYKMDRGKLFSKALKEWEVENLARGTKKVPKKSILKRVLGKTLSKVLPGAGAVIIARDVVKGISKATCSKRGGKWVSGKCQGAKKTKLKAGSKVRDPISKR